MIRIKILPYLLVTLFMAGLSGVSASEPIRVAFINPDKVGNGFWDLVTEKFVAAAEDLNVDASVHYANQDRFGSYQIVERLINKDAAPDYFIFMYQIRSTKKILDLTEKHKIKSFIINTRVHPLEEDLVGKPRERYKYWLGQMFPDDVQAGKDLARYLIAEYAKQGAATVTPLVGLSGSQDSSAALERNRGLVSIVDQKNTVRLEQIVFAQWSGEVAVKQLDVLLNRYPDTRIVWAASDHMAIEGAKYLKEKRDRSRFVIGGIDWTLEGLGAVKNGLINVSVGGHFGEAAWALVMLHDYHNGIDFVDQGLVTKTQMQTVHAGNVDRFFETVLVNDFEPIDYKKFSRFFNPKLNRYNFGFDSVTDIN